MLQPLRPLVGEQDDYPSAAVQQNAVSLACLRRVTDAGENLEVSFVVTPEMLYRVQQAITSRTRWFRWLRIWMAVVLPLGALAIPVALGGSLSDVLRENAGMLIAFPVFFGLGIPLLQRWSAKRLWRTTPGLQGELRYAIESTGIRQFSTVSTADIAWQGIVRAVETKEFMLFYPSNAMAYFIPRSATPTQGSWESLREVVVAAIGERAQLAAASNGSGTAR